MPRLKEPIYESLPVLYVAAGAALLWLSYRGRHSWWSALCALGGFLAMVGGLAIWMRRRDYRATSVDYRRLGRPPGGSKSEEPP